MTPEMRYMVANARIAALADVQSWTAQDLQDVFALVSPSVALDEWLKRVQITPVAAAPVVEAAEDPDPDTTRTMAMLLGPEGKRLEDLGILSIKEEPAT